jgi:energy-converting hydrogenase Eha subunit C
VLSISDGLVKPLLAALHNGVIVPVAAFLSNVASAVKTSLDPIAGILLLMTEPLGRLLQSCRLIDIHHHHHHKPVIRDV